MEGSGTGTSHKNLSKTANPKDCIKLVTQLEPTANGATWGTNGDLDCFAEFEATPTEGNGAFAYRTCVIESMFV